MVFFNRNILNLALDRRLDTWKAVTQARIYGGLHFRESMQDGEQLAERTTRHVLRHSFDND